MTPEQKRQINALRNCRFLPGSWAKRFVSDMAFLLDKDPDRALTERQSHALEGLCHNYRKQHNACRCEECLRNGESNPFQLGMFGEEAEA